MSWVVAIVLALLLRYEMGIREEQLVSAMVIMAIAIVVQAVAGYGLGLYRGRYPFGSFQEAKALVIVTVIAAASITVSLLVLYRPSGSAAASDSSPSRSPASLWELPGTPKALRRGQEPSRRRRPEHPDLRRGLPRQLPADAHAAGRRLAVFPGPADRRRSHQEAPAAHRVQVLGRGDDDLPGHHSGVPAPRCWCWLSPTSRLPWSGGFSDAVAGMNVRVLVLPPLRDMLGGGAPQGFSDFATWRSRT